MVAQLPPEPSSVDPVDCPGPQKTHCQDYLEDDEPQPSLEESVASNESDYPLESESQVTPVKTMPRRSSILKKRSSKDASMSSLSLHSSHSTHFSLEDVCSKFHDNWTMHGTSSRLNLLPIREEETAETQARFHPTCLQQYYIFIQLYLKVTRRYECSEGL